MSEGKSKDDWSDLLKTEALVLRSGQSWADIVDDDDEDVDVSDESIHKDRESATITAEPIENNQKPVDYLEDIDITIPITQLASKQTSNETRFDWDNEQPQHPSHDSDNWRVRDSKGADSDNWRVRDPQGDGPKKSTSFANFSNRDRFEKQEDRLNYRHFEKQEDRSEYRQPEKRRVDPEDAAALEKWNSFHLVVAQEELEKEKEKERLKKRFLESERKKTSQEDDGTLLSSELVKGDTNQQICINSNEAQEKNIDQIQNTDESKLDLEPAEKIDVSEGTQSKVEKVETNTNDDSAMPKEDDVASLSKEQEQEQGDQVLKKDQSSTSTLGSVEPAPDKNEATEKEKVKEKEDKDEDQKSLTNEDTSSPQKEISVTMAQEDSDPVSTKNLTTPTEIKDSENKDDKSEEDVTKENTQAKEDITVLDEESKAENESSTNENRKKVENTTENPEETVLEEIKESRDAIDEKENDQEAKDKMVNEKEQLVSQAENDEDETRATHSTMIDKNDASDKKDEAISIEKDQTEENTPSHDEEQSSPVKEEKKEEEEKVKMDTPTEQDQITKANFEIKHEKSPISIREDEEEETKSLSNHKDTEAIDDEKSTPIAETEKVVEQEDIKENRPVSPKQQEEVLEAQAVESEHSKSSTETELSQEEKSESQRDQNSKEESQSSCLLESEDVEEKEKKDIEEKKDTENESNIDGTEITTDKIGSSTEEKPDKDKESQLQESVNSDVKEDGSLEEVKVESSILNKQDNQDTTLSSGPVENELSRNIEEEKEKKTGEKGKEADTQNIQFIEDQNQMNKTLNEYKNENSASTTDQVKESLDSNEANKIDSNWNKENVKELNQAEPTGWGDKPTTEDIDSSTEAKKEETGWDNAAGWTQESKKEVKTDTSESLANEGSQWGEPKGWNSSTNQPNDQPQLNNGASWNQEKQLDKPSWGQDQNLNNTMSTSSYGRRISTSSSWGAIDQAKSPKVAAKKPSPGSWRSQMESAPKDDNAGGWKQFATNEAAINIVKETRVESPKPKKAFLPKNMQSSPKLDKSWTSDNTSWSKTSDITTQTTISSTPSQSDTHQADPSWSKTSKSPNITQANPSWSTIQEPHSKPSTLTNENASWSQTQNNWSKSQAWSATTQAQLPPKPHEATTTTQPIQQQQPLNGAPPVFNISLSDFDSIQLEHKKEEVEKKAVLNAPIEINLDWNGGDIILHPPTENINMMQAPLTVVLDDKLQELQVTPKIEHATLPPVQQMHSTTTTATTATSESTDFWSQQSQNNEWNLAYHDAHPEPSSSTESGGHKTRPRIQMGGSQWKLMNKFLKNK